MAGAGYTFSDQEEPLHRAQVDQGGQRPRTPTGKSMKRVYSQPVIGPGRSFSPEAWGKAASVARWRPGSVLFPQQEVVDCCFMMGTVPCTGPGTHRVSLKASTRCRPDEARKPFGQIPPRNSGRPRKLSPHPSFSHTHSRWRYDKEQSPNNPQTGQIREKKKKKNHILRTSHQGSPYPQNREVQNSHPPADWWEAEGLRDRVQPRGFQPPRSYAGPLSPPPLPGPQRQQRG